MKVLSFNEQHEHLLIKKNTKYECTCVVTAPKLQNNVNSKSVPPKKCPNENKIKKK